MICPTCRSEIQPGSKFCVRCGARLEGGHGAAHAAPGADHAPVPPPPPVNEPVQNADGFPHYGQGQIPGAAPDYVPPQYAPPPGDPGAYAPQGPSEFVLQPLGFGELFDTTIKIYTRYFWMLVGTVAVVMIPLLIIAALVFGVFMLSMSVQTSIMGTFMLIPGMLALVIAMAVQQGALVKIVSDIYLGEAPSIRKAYRTALSKVGAIILAALLYGLAAGFGMILCLAPGIYLWIAMSMYVCAVMFEGKGAAASLSRSMDLIRGSWWKVFVLLFLAQALVGMVTNVPSMFFTLISVVSRDLIWVKPIGDLIGFGLQIFVAPLITIVTILMYYDLRVRKEGYDLEIMAREIG